MQKHENSSDYQQVLLCKLPQSTKVHLAKDWQVKALSEVAKINPETINEKYLHNEILYVDISSIENYEIKMYERLALKDRPSRAQRIIKKDDIIVSNVRPYLRAFAQVSDTKDNLVCSTGFTVIRPHSKYHADFIFNYIKSHNFEVNMIRYMEGLAYPAVTSEVIANSLIPWPAKSNETQKIGEVLSYADELIQNTCRIIEQTRRLKNGLMRKLFTRGIGHSKFKHVSFGGQVTENIPDSWQLISVEELCNGGTQNGIAISIDDYGKGIPIVGMTNLFANDVLNYVGLNEVRNMKGMDKFYLKSGDLLFGRRSMNVKGAGKCVYVDEVPHPIVFESSIIRMSLNSEKVIPKFLFYLFYSRIGIRIMTRIVQVVAVSGITGHDLRKIKIAIPRDKSEQQKVVSILSNIDSILSNESAWRNHLETLKKGLMQKLLTGTIRVNG